MEPQRPFYGLNLESNSFLQTAAGNLTLSPSAAWQGEDCGLTPWEVLGLTLLPSARVSPARHGDRVALPLCLKKPAHQPQLKPDKLQQDHEFPQKITREAKETTKDRNKQDPDRAKIMSQFSSTMAVEI